MKTLFSVRTPALRASSIDHIDDQQLRMMKTTLLHQQSQLVLGYSPYQWLNMSVMAPLTTNVINTSSVHDSSFNICFILVYSFLSRDICNLPR